MSINTMMDDAALTANVTRCGSACEALVLLFVLYALSQSVETFAGDASPRTLDELQPIVGGTPLSMAFVPDRSVTGAQPPRATDFSRRTTPASDSPSPVAAEPSALQPLHSTSAWQRLADYRSQGRVQLLTLWQSPRSTVSLQAGKHGGPSLQWTSRIMNRGGATRGLLDRFVASSLGAAGFGSKQATHGANSPTLNKNSIPLAVPKSP